MRAPIDSIESVKFIARDLVFAESRPSSLPITNEFVSYQIQSPAETVLCRISNPM